VFIQLIKGKLGDEAGLRRCLDRWETDLMPGATGYLGTTAGRYGDDGFVAVARFESADAARRNSERAEQSAWWAETEKCFAGNVSFLDCDQVDTWLDGGSDDAGFVQIMTGTSPDAHRMHELMSRASDTVHEARPEILGGLMAEADGGRWVDIIYFTSEQDARKGEQLEMPEDMRKEFEEGMQLMGEVNYLDLKNPILVSAH
jgi:hypothetical protein